MSNLLDGYRLETCRHDEKSMWFSLSNTIPLLSGLYIQCLYNAYIAWYLLLRKHND